MNSASASDTADDAMETRFHFVLLHHGYHGRARDFYYLSDTAEDILNPEHFVTPHLSQSSSPHFVFIHPHGSDRIRTEQGVLACAERYIARVAAKITETLSAYAAQKSDTHLPDGAGEHDDVSRASSLDIHISAVGHSMGGLVLRAALPRIMASVDQIVSRLPGTHHVEWDSFCTMATPHLGVHYMRSPVMTCLGHNVGHHLSTAIADLFCKNALITTDLVSDESLAAWAKFKRRVLLNVVNDGTVLVYSSSFVMPVSVRVRIGAAVPAPIPAAQDASAGGAPENASDFSTAEAARGPSRDQPQASARAHMKQDVPNSDASVVHLASHGIYCASTIEGLRRNAYELRELSEDLWPAAVLPEQRALAERILSRVGPLELHLADFRPLCDAPVAQLPQSVATARAQLSFMGSWMTHLGSHRFSHAAMACKSPFYYPPFFGFVSDYVISDILMISERTNESKKDVQDSKVSEEHNELQD